MKVKLGLTVLALCGAVLCIDVGTALAQSYPSKPIRLIVPWTAGGATDIFARIIGQKLTEGWGQQVVVDNRPGASGIIGFEIAARAVPDGYTILLAAQPFTVNTSLFSKLPYDVVKDFAPVTLMAYTTNILVVHPAVPAESVSELITLAKSKPGQLNFASMGSATTGHLLGEMFKIMAGVDMVHIPYKGSAPAMTDLLGGRVSLMFDTVPSAMPHVKAGKLRALAVTSAKRSPLVPDLPTVAESGLPGFESAPWYGAVVPAGTPKEIITKLYTEIVKILNMPDVKDRLSNYGYTIIGSTPEQFADFIKTDMAKWAKVIKDAGIHVD